MISFATKGFCEIAAPIGIAYGGMAGLDELRKIKGLEPIFFLPFIADIIIGDTESQQVLKENRAISARIVNNKIEEAYLN